ncbi:MAG: hypothetical protein RL071_3389, partial [Pseudomonadota bacterium]
GGRAAGGAPSPAGAAPPASFDAAALGDRLDLLADGAGGLWLISPDAEQGAGAVRWFGPGAAPAPALTVGAPGAHLGDPAGTCGAALLLLGPPAAEGAPLLRLEPGPSPALRTLGPRAPAGALRGGALACDGSGAVVLGAPLEGPGGAVWWLGAEGPAPAVLDLPPGGLAGAPLLAGLDLNADGLADLVIATPGAAERAGGLLVVLDARPGAAHQADLRLVGPTAHDWAGFSLAAVDDSDGDGRPELLVGAFGADGADYGAGAALLIDPLRPDALAAPLAIHLGRAGSDHAGFAVAAQGAHLLIGAPGADDGAPEGGAIFRVPAAARGAQPLVAPTWAGLTAGDRLGEAFAPTPGGVGVLRPKRGAGPPPPALRWLPLP